MTRAGPNPVHPARMTAEERLAEVSDLLATAFLRFAERRRTRGTSEHLQSAVESRLDFQPTQSGAPHRRQRREKAF